MIQINRIDEKNGGERGGKKIKREAETGGKGIKTT